MSTEIQKRLIIGEIKRFCELYKPEEGIGEGGLDELADKILSFSNDYISKDKIREKIKELEEKSDYWNCDEIQVLRELLEENNEKSNTL